MLVSINPQHVNNFSQDRPGRQVHSHILALHQQHTEVELAFEAEGWPADSSSREQPNMSFGVRLLGKTCT